MKQLVSSNQCRSHQDQIHRSACSPCLLFTPTTSSSCLCLRIAVGQNIVQIQYVYSVTHHISQDPQQRSACFVPHSPSCQPAAGLLQFKCHGHEGVTSPNLVASALPLHPTTSIHYCTNGHKDNNFSDCYRSFSAQTCGRTPRHCMQPTVTAKVSQRLSSRTA